MAFLRQNPQCDAPGCTATSTWTLITWRNDTHGHYCTKHSPGAQKKLEEAESRYFEQQRTT